MPTLDDIKKDLKRDIKTVIAEVEIPKCGFIAKEDLTPQITQSAEKELYSFLDLTEAIGKDLIKSGSITKDPSKEELKNLKESVNNHIDTINNKQKFIDKILVKG